ncbi:MAG: tryptophan synthase subunit alpha [Actinomycetota bacterium]
MTALPLEKRLIQRLDGGHKLLVIYLTAGLPSPQVFVDLYCEIGKYADVIEVGIPFSDPIMDGPIIQRASTKALEDGVTPEAALRITRQALSYSETPAVFMSYFNPIHRMGVSEFAAAAAKSGASGLIVPDLPFDESSQLEKALSKKKVALIQMVAPTTSAQRCARLAAASHGWVYAVSRMGVTGEQMSLSDAAAEVVHRTKPHSKVPVLVGIGITNPAQAAEAAEEADGVIVGSAIVKRVLANDIDGAVELARSLREALP